MNKSFRGRLAHMTSTDDILRIRLSTNDGLTGYEIVKFQLFPEKPGTSTGENLVQIHSTKPTALPTEVNFNNPLILAVGFVGASTNNTQLAPIPSVVFDAVKINQDIYITHDDESGNASPVNFYLELKTVKLDLNEATVATLKDMRGRE